MTCIIIIWWLLFYHFEGRAVNLFRFVYGCFCSTGSMPRVYSWYSVQRSELPLVVRVAVKLPGSLGMRKSGTPNPMTAAGKQEHAIVAQTIEEIIGPRLTAEVWSLFFFGSGGGNSLHYCLCSSHSLLCNIKLFLDWQPDFSVLQLSWLYWICGHCQSFLRESCLV